MSRQRSGVRNAYVFVICGHALVRLHQDRRCTETHSSEGRLQEVAHRRGRTLGLRVAILDTRKLEKTLRRGRSNETGTTGGGDETAHDGADLAADLGGHGVGLTEVGTPVASPDGDDGELGEDDGATDGGRDLLRALDTETDVAVEIANGDERLKARALTGAGLLLHGHDLHDLVLELGEEEVDDLELLDGEREEVDLLHGLDLAILHETAELGDGDPGSRGWGWNGGRSRYAESTHHSFSSSLRPPRRGPRRPRPRSPRPRPKPPRPRAESAIV